MILDFFKIKHECKHTKVNVEVEEAYCPDCGALIQNKWYLMRCSCCNIKRSAHTHYDNIVPDSKYCKNCGSADYYIQELEKPNFTDIHYAVFKKIIINQQNTSTNQIWVDEKKETNQNQLTGMNIMPMLLNKYPIQS